MTRVALCAGLAAIFLFGGFAHANIIGDEITGSYELVGEDDNLMDNTTAIVGDGVEFTNTSSIPGLSSSTLEYDFEGETLFVTYEIFAADGIQANLLPHDLEFGDFDWLDSNGDAVYGAVTGFSLVNGVAPELGPLGFTPTSVMFSFGTISVIETTRIITLEFEIEVTHDAPLVPEPTTMTLLTLGLAGMGYIRRRAA